MYNKEELDPALVYINDLVKTGFYNIKEICDKIPVFEKERLGGEQYVENYITIKFQKYNLEEKINTHYFDKLSILFDSFCNERIIALHKAGYKNEDAFEQIDLVIEKLNKKPFGYIFYIERELFHALDSNILYLSFGAFRDSEKTANNGKDKADIGDYFVERLNEEGLKASWNGDINSKIAIAPFYWEKKYDDQDWSVNRCINIINSVK